MDRIDMARNIAHRSLWDATPHENTEYIMSGAGPTSTPFKNSKDPPHIYHYVIEKTKHMNSWQFQRKHQQFMGC